MQLSNHQPGLIHLADLLRDEGLGKQGATLPSNQPINGIAFDSRDVRPGDVFVAIRGLTSDGNDYINAAIAKGAVAVISDAAGKAGNRAVPIIKVKAPRLSLGRMAARFYRHKPAMLTAVTGTNGKTSVVDFLSQIWERNGWRTASIGTLGVRLGVHLTDWAGVGTQTRTSELGLVGSEWQPSRLTTPDAVTLNRTLTQLAEAEISHVALEASSHGIEQHRLAGLPIAVAGFTNLSRDHLDHHRNLKAYYAAKARLFTDVLMAAGTAVINSDSSHAQQLIKDIGKRRLRLITVGHAKPSRAMKEHFQIAKIDRHAWGQDVAIVHAGETHHLPLALFGSFQMDNAVLAAALGYASGMTAKQALLALPYLRAVPGRMQSLAVPDSTARVVIDYAHTPDALAMALQSLRESLDGQLGVVFGCGGDRDPGKRGEMGKLAARLSDFTIITDDNPRHEDPAAIRADIRAACPDATELGDRAKAIAHGISQLKDGDVLLVAGKGHETQQLIGDDTLPFSDAATVQAIFAKRHSGQSSQEAVL